jgi:hypothetical protein
VDEHVRARDQLVHDRLPLLRAQIDRDPLFAAVDTKEELAGARMLQGIAGRRLDLNDTRAQVAEDTGSTGAGGVHRQVEDSNAGECALR